MAYLTIGSDTEPLLLSDENLDESINLDAPTVANSPIQQTRALNEREWYNIARLAIVIFLYTFNYYLLVIPTQQLYENAICREYYKDRVWTTLQNPNENRCKVPQIRSRLATLLGWKMSFDAVPGLFTAMWFGSLADRHGKRPILLLAMVGEVCSLVWLLLVCMMTFSSLFYQSIHLTRHRLFFATLFHPGYLRIVLVFLLRRRAPGHRCDTFCKYRRRRAY